MKRIRANISSDQDVLKFQNAQFPKQEYDFIHPTMQTVGSDLLIIVKTKSKKPVAIPVRKDFMAKTIDYFKREHDETSNWRESKPTEGGVRVWEVPENINAYSVDRYIKSLYDDSVMPLDNESCIGILQLADYWCDEYMKAEALAFIKKEMNSDMVSRVYDNSAVRDILKGTVMEFIEAKVNLSVACCACCKMSDIYQFDVLAKTPQPFCLSQNNTKLTVVNLTNDVKWSTVYSKPIPENAESFNFSFQLKLSSIKNTFGNILCGIVASVAFDEQEDNVGVNEVQDYQSSGFQLKKHEHDVSDEVKRLNNETILSFSGFVQELADISIIHESEPSKKFSQDDIFTLTYNKDELLLTNKRGFKGSVKLENVDASMKYRFFFTVFTNDKNMIGSTVEIVRPCDTHECQVQKLQNQSK